MVKGQFRLFNDRGAWVICDEANFSLELTGILIDGSGRKEKYPDGIIVSRERREMQAGYVLAALQHYSGSARFITPYVTLVFDLSKEDNGVWSARAKANSMIELMGNTDTYVWEALADNTFKYTLQ